MAEVTFTKVPTDLHKQIKSLKKTNSAYKDITIFGIYRKVLEAGFKSLGIEKKSPLRS